MSNNDWTPVSTLPESQYAELSGAVLICRKRQYQAQPDMFIAWYDHRRCQWRNNFGEIKNVTHWRPLPEPPEEYQSKDKR